MPETKSTSTDGISSLAADLAIDDVSSTTEKALGTYAFNRNQAHEDITTSRCLSTDGVSSTIAQQHNRLMNEKRKSTDDVSSTTAQPLFFHSEDTTVDNGKKGSRRHP